MSDQRLQKNIDRGCNRKSAETEVKLHSTPLVLSDSKGRYLKQVVNRKSNIEKNIIWCYKGGATSSERLDWFRNQSTDVVKKYGSVTLYVWAGTCGFTVKDSTHECRKGNNSHRPRKLISLRHPEEAFNKFKHNLHEFKRLCTGKHIQVTFLQVPYYSIQTYNAQKGHGNPDIFKKDDNTLTALIERVNDFIVNLNCEVNSYSPSFNDDLRRSRKKRGAAPRYSINFRLLQDGLHPSEKLARSWLTSLVRKISKDCV